MKSFSAFLLFSFVSIVLLGFVGMQGMDERGGCIASIMAGAECMDSNAFAQIAFHFNALRVFTTAVIAASILFALLVVVRRSGELMKSLKSPFARMPVSESWARLNRETYVFPARESMRAWCALHETSPTNSIVR